MKCKNLMLSFFYGGRGGGWKDLLQCPKGFCIRQENQNHSRWLNRRNFMQGLSYPGDGKDKKGKAIINSGKALPTEGWKEKPRSQAAQCEVNLNRAACWKLVPWRRGVSNGTWDYRGSAASRDPPPDRARQEETLASPLPYSCPSLPVPSKPTSRQPGNSSLQF